VRSWKCGLANEEVQRITVEADEFLELDQIFAVFPALRFAIIEIRRLSQALGRGDLSQKHRFPLIRESGGYAFAG